MLQRANKHLTGKKTQRNFLCAQQHERQYSIVKLFHHVQCVSEQASQNDQVPPKAYTNIHHSPAEMQ